MVCGVPLITYVSNNGGAEGRGDVLMLMLEKSSESKR